MKKIWVGLLVLLVLLSVNVMALSVTPTNWNINYDKGNNSVPMKIFTVNNPSNISQQLTISMTGDEPTWFNIDKSGAVTIPASDIEDITVALKINEVEPGVYFNNLDLTFQQIPITLVVTSDEPQQSEQDCYLSPLVSSYIKKIRSDAMPFTKTFSVTVAGNCPTLDIQQPIPLNTYTGLEGEQPIALTGSLSLGMKNPGETATFDIEFNVNGLESGAYNPKLLIIGKDSDGNKYETTIYFDIIVTKSITPATNSTFDSLPDCVMPSSPLNLNRTYSLKCVDWVDKNIDINIPYNEYFQGISVDESSISNEFIWNFQPAKLGKTNLKVHFTYKNVPIGETLNYAVEIKEDSYASGGSAMKIIFYPDLAMVSPGDEVSILVKDNDTESIITGATLYKNGRTMTGNSFIAVGGEIVSISVSHPNFPSVEETFTILKEKIDITPSETVVDVLETITFTTTPNGAKLSWNNTEIPKTWTPTMDGVYTIRAELPNYEPNAIAITVLKPLEVLNVSEHFKLNQESDINLNRKAQVQILYQPSENDIIIPVFNEITSNAVFTPDKPGTYYIEIDGQPYDEKIVNKGLPQFNFNKKWAIVFIAVTVIGLIIWRNVTNGGGREGDKVGFVAYPPGE